MVNVFPQFFRRMCHASTKYVSQTHMYRQTHRSNSITSIVNTGDSKVVKEERRRRRLWTVKITFNKFNQALIYIYFRGICSWVSVNISYSVTASPAQTVGPMTLYSISDFSSTPILSVNDA